MLNPKTLKALAELGIPRINWARAATPEELLYLVDRWAFLQIVRIDETHPFLQPQFIHAKSGWIIHHYGDAMSSSPGEMRPPKNKGTLVKQAYDTAAEMIEQAQKYGWKGAEIVDGHPLMQWAAWMQAEDDHFVLNGYTPKERDLKKRESIKRSCEEDQLQMIHQLK